MEEEFVLMNLSNKKGGERYYKEQLQNINQKDNKRESTKRWRALIHRRSKNNQ